MRSRTKIALAAAPLFVATLFAQTAVSPELTTEQVITGVIRAEARFERDLAKFRPVIETYVQFMDKDKGPNHKNQVSSDAYFIGKLKADPELNFENFAPEKSSGFHILSFLKRPERLRLLPIGFGRMTMLDPEEFDRSHYIFENLHREFVGEVRCYVLDVRPRDKEGRFVGRIWAEDRDFHIVRYSGTYASKYLVRYFHFNGYRQQMGPGLWLPSSIYVEHSFKNIRRRNFPAGLKAQVRLWSYGLSARGKSSTFTNIRIDTPEPAQDRSASDLSTTEALREWKHEAENNVLEKMERAGLLATEGEMEKILDAVLNNLLVTNKIVLAPPVRCRILLTTPFESCAIGHSIVLSRGLIDVLPNEATLAAVIARELAGILLGNDIETINAFHDRMLFDDSKVFQQFSFRRSQQEEENANRKALELLNNSPYKQDLPSIGLFLAALQTKIHAMPNLLKAYVGNPVAENGRIALLPSLVQAAPPLAPQDIAQIPALPLGSRLRLEPWDNRAEVVNAKPVAILSMDEKLPFEVTPIVLSLRRQSAAR
jgi:hypothetical protein